MIDDAEYILQFSSKELNAAARLCRAVALSDGWYTVECKKCNYYYTDKSEDKAHIEVIIHVLKTHKL